MTTRIAQLAAGQRFDSFFGVTSVRSGLTKSGNEYLTLHVQDLTGSAAGRVWSPAQVCPGGVEAPGVFSIAGRAESFKDELQLNIEHIEPYTPTPEEFDLLVPGSRWPGETLVIELRAHLEARVSSPRLRRLLLAILDHGEVKPYLTTAAAASGNHHAFRAGLAEHTLSMMRLASLIAGHYESYYPGLVSEEVLLAGVLLHDLGKVWELQGVLAAEYTTVGRLVGHIPMGAAFIAKIAGELGDTPDELVWELQHLVLAHHGEYEYGSPKRPKTVEAQILHFIDNMDARTQVFAQAAARPGWTQPHRMMGRPLLNPAELRKTWQAPAEPSSIESRGPGRPVGPPATAAEPVASGAAPESKPGASRDSALNAPTAPVAPPPGAAAARPTQGRRRAAPERSSDIAPTGPVSGPVGSPISGAMSGTRALSAQQAERRGPPPDSEPIDRASVVDSTLSLFDGLK